MIFPVYFQSIFQGANVGIMAEGVGFEPPTYQTQPFVFSFLKFISILKQPEYTNFIRTGLRLDKYILYIASKGVKF